MSLYLTFGHTVSTTQTTLMDDVIHPQRVHFIPESYQGTKHGYKYAPHNLANMVLAPATLEWLKKNPALGKTAFILASGNSHFAGINPRENQKNTQLHYIYKFLPFSLTQVVAGRLANQICEPDYVATDATACTSSLKALMDCIMLEAFGYTRFIILTVEDAVSNSVLEFFGDSGASLTLDEEIKENTVPSAFDRKNRGFYVGQGAAFAVLQSEGEVNYYNMKPKARLVSAYHAAEKHDNAIGQRLDGNGYISAIEGAMRYGDVHPQDIAIVKTHGTGTESNNESESMALFKTLDNFVATSYKQKIGHTMGASGLLETLLLLDNLVYGVVPAIPNRTEKDHIFLSEDCETPDGLILSLAAGMGNVYTAAIFEPMR
jgi:3-oxoacyl-(acyl-carrier-protein) synthase